MSIYNDGNISEVYYCDAGALVPISEIYNGSDLVYSGRYPSGTVLFDSGTAGTYTLEVKKDCTVSVILVGAGGGGSYSKSYNQWTNTKTGGSGGMITGNCTLAKGTYTIIVGAAGTGLYSVNGGGGAGGTAGSGGTTTFLGNQANGGGGAHTWTGYFDSRGTNGSAGTYSIATSGLSGTNGSAGSTTNRYSSYGGGGPGNGGSAVKNNGKSGYCKITVL